MTDYAIGDIHGRIEALKQVLEKSHFDYEKDQLIILGDVADGGNNVYETVEELLKIKNKIFILGNHDEWFIRHMKTGWSEDAWLHQGGRNTLESYRKSQGNNIPTTHQEFFNNAILYHHDKKKNYLYVHGGIQPDVPLEEQERIILLWDRELWCYHAAASAILPYEKIFIGHTSTQAGPWKKGNVWNLDTGAGWDGRLTIMNVDTEEYWQSDKQDKPI